VTRAGSAVGPLVVHRLHAYRSGAGMTMPRQTSGSGRCNSSVGLKARSRVVGCPQAVARGHREADAGRAGADHRRGRCRDRRVPRGALGHRVAPDRGAEGSDAGCGVSAYHYFYGEPMDTEASTAAWQKWLTDLFPAPNPAPTLPDSLPDSAVALAFVVRRVRRRTP
jgi:hypothetical protein